MNKKQHILDRVQRNVPILYGAMVAIGMLFEYYRYKVFGINIFQYADIFDFLIAPFKDFMIIAFLLGTICIVSIGYLLDKLLQKWPKLYSFLNFGLTQKSWFKVYSQLSMLTVFFVYLILSSHVLAKINYNNVLNQKNTIVINFLDEGKMEGNLIGKTKEVVFLYIDDKVTILPSTSLIKTIQYKEGNNTIAFSQK